MSAGNDLTTQVMMTLAGLAGTAAVERPSGEVVAVQEKRIFNGIAAQLQDQTLATEGKWEPIWLGMTRDRANLAYIAQAPTTAGPYPYAVVLRGTAFSMSIDVSEDMKVGVLLPFEPAVGFLATAPGAPQISQGSMRAFTEMVTAVCHPGVSPVKELEGTTLVEAVKLLIDNALAPPPVYVTGHSLGGAMATTLGLYLKTVPFRKPAAIQVYTFAAPTAGDRGFASAFNAAFPNAVCVWNKYDVVPNAWWNLVNTEHPDQGVDHFFPHLFSHPGPEATVLVKELVNEMNARAAPGYTQPTQQAALNQDYKELDHGCTEKTTKDWMCQAAYQHQNNTYLKLLGAKLLTDRTPSVLGINPNYGPTAGKTPVTITGANFTQDSKVDFGVVPGINPVASKDGKTITVISPAGVGIVDVTVTTMFGTSTADITNDQFSYRKS
jgi:hypothetical protein